MHFIVIASDDANYFCGGISISLVWFFTCLKVVLGLNTGSCVSCDLYGYWVLFLFEIRVPKSLGFILVWFPLIYLRLPHNI